jgi:hypothetical protein
MIKHSSREAWLNACADLILDKFREIFEIHFGQEGIDHLEHLKVSTGFPSRGGLTKVIGECWAARAAADETTHHIFINPRLDDVVEVVATLAHEMVHAADDGEHKHKGPFVKAVREMGLEGKATATVAGAAFADWARGLDTKIGTSPHVALVPLSTQKKQSTRMLKLEADCCGYVVRTTRKWLEVGHPSCPCGNEMPEAPGQKPADEPEGVPA